MKDDKRKSKQLELYKQFIEHCTTVSKSIRNYTDFKRINECLQELFPKKEDITILDFNDTNEFESVVMKLKEQSSFIQINSTGQNQYSNTLAYYLRFLNAKQMFSQKEEELQNNNIATDLPLQQIFYGAPGTGKSNTIKREVDEKGKKNFRTTFHPDSDYSTFVGCYKPMMKESTITKDGVTSKEEKIIYSFCPQAFTNAYVEAWSTEEEVFLIIEEINRGNCAQIFGDLFQLLDRKDGESEYPIIADKDLGDHIASQLAASPRTDIPQEVKEGKLLKLPNNLYIWATMNTSDQSLFPIDSAFKRRWDWQYMPICKGRDKQGYELTWKIRVGELLFDWWIFLENINEQIGTTTSSEDKKLGYFFCKAVDGIISAETFVSKVVFYLWNDVFKDFDFDNSIFNDDENGKLSFNKFYTMSNYGKVVVNEKKVLKFMENLGVMGEDINDLGEDDEKNDDENSDLNVTFPDGTIVTGRTRFDSYISTIKKIGIENIKSIIPNLKYKRLGAPLISLEKYDAIVNNDQRYSYVEVEGCYFIKGMNGRTMRKVLLAISDLLKLNLIIEYK